MSDESPATLRRIAEEGARLAGRVLAERFQGERIIARIPKGSLGLGPVERLDPQSSTERAL